MFLCQRLFHECLGYDLDGNPLDAKTCPGLIPESSGFIPYEDLPSFWIFQRLALFHRYANRKLQQYLVVLVAVFVLHWLKVINISI